MAKRKTVKRYKTGSQVSEAEAKAAIDAKNEAASKAASDQSSSNTTAKIGSQVSSSDAARAIAEKNAASGGRSESRAVRSPQTKAGSQVDDSVAQAAIAAKGLPGVTEAGGRGRAPSPQGGELARAELLGKRDFSQSVPSYGGVVPPGLDLKAPETGAYLVPGFDLPFDPQFAGMGYGPNPTAAQVAEAYQYGGPSMGVYGVPAPGPMQGPPYPGPMQGPTYPGPMQGPVLPQPTPRPFEPDMSQYSPTVPPGDVVSATSPLGTPEAAAAAAQARAAYEEMQQRVLQGSSPGPVQGPVQGVPAPLPSMADAQRMMEINQTPGLGMPGMPTSIVAGMEAPYLAGLRDIRAESNRIIQGAMTPGQAVPPSPAPQPAPSLPDRSFMGPNTMADRAALSAPPRTVPSSITPAPRRDPFIDMLPGELLPPLMNPVPGRDPFIDMLPGELLPPAPAQTTPPVRAPIPTPVPPGLGDAPVAPTTDLIPKQIANDTAQTAQGVPPAVALPGVGPMIGGLQDVFGGIRDVFAGQRPLFGEGGIFPANEGDPFEMMRRGGGSEDPARPPEVTDPAAMPSEKPAWWPPGVPWPPQQGIAPPVAPPVSPTPTQSPTPGYQSYNDLMAAATMGYPLGMAGGGMVRPSMTNAFTPGSYYAMYDPRKRGLGGM